MELLKEAPAAYPEDVMKKIVLFLVLLIISTAAFSQGLEITPKIDYGLSVYQNWLAPSILVDYMFNDVIGLGAESVFYFGFEFKDIYSALAAVLKIGPLCIGGGVSTKLKDSEPNEEYQEFAYGTTDNVLIDNSINPYGYIGVVVPIKTLGPGKLGFNWSMDILLSDVPISIDADSDNFLGNIISVMFQAIFGSMFGSVKSRIGLNYSI